jgi:penicillin-binding protein 2
MQNRLLPTYTSQSSGNAGSNQQIGWNHRLLAVFVIFAVCFIAIAIRLAYIQIQLRENYVDTFNTTRVEFESIPGRDGRILTDQAVFATDVARYDVEVHYRWLEEPADRNWLTQKARGEIPGTQRRTEELLETARQTVLNKRSEMWRRLSIMSEVPETHLQSRRAGIQTRVEKIAASVNRRHKAREVSKAETVAKPGLTGMFEQAKQAITSPPQRLSLAPIIVKEELAYHPIASNVSLEVAAEIRAHPELYPGLRVKDSTARLYPKSTLAAHLIGTRSRDVEADSLDRVGRSGIERSYDGHLRGIDGQRQLTFDRRGEIISTKVLREPLSGRDVVLTIESDLQKSAELLLDEALAGQSNSNEKPSPTPPGGCILVMDAHSGDILTIANAPRFDLNLMVRPSGDTWNSTVNDPRHPLFPRATQMTVPPGSVFKVLSAAAMLEATDVDPLSHRFCQGYLDRPDRHRCYIFRHFGVGHGNVTLRSALAQSCNVYFFQAARLMGPEPLADWATRFGFGQPTGIDLPFERRGNVPNPRQSKQAGGSQPRWYAGDTLGLAIGQSRLTVTPLQVATMMAAVANGGYLVTPRVTESVRSERGKYKWAARPRRRIAGLSQQTISEIQHGLFSAVNDPAGTGYKTVRLDEVSIAGKTGTAEVGGNKPDHAWFSGYVPADRPRFAFVVMLEHGGSGGSAAGPLARKLVQSMIRTGLLVPSEGTVSQVRVD